MREFSRLIKIIKIKKYKIKNRKSNLLKTRNFILIIILLKIYL